MIYLVGEEVRVARCVHGCYGRRDVIYLVGEEVSRLQDVCMGVN